MDGPAFVKAVMASCPWTRILVTGGVDATEASIRACFEAGAACVGMGSKLIRKDLVAAGDLDTISDLAARVAANARRWWRNSRLLLNRLMPIAYFDRLGVPRLS